MTVRVSKSQSQYLRWLSRGIPVTRHGPTEDALERAGYITRDGSTTPRLTTKGRAFVGLDT